MAVIDVDVYLYGPRYSHRTHRRRIHPTTLTLTSGAGNYNITSTSSTYAPVMPTGTTAQLITYEWEWIAESTRDLWRGWATIVPEVPLSGFEPESSA